MKKIIFICPYFGKLPKYFPLVLISMKYNSSIDWLVITDDRTNYKYPTNVHVQYCSFEQINEKIKNSLGINNLHSAYKLCDVKPFYGLVFKEYISNYDFYGHCDFDCCFGDIRKYITDDILSKYNKVLFLGHMSLYKNNKVMENVISDYLSLNSTIKMLNSAYPCQLDEVEIIGFLKRRGLEIFDEQGMIADIDCLNFEFNISSSILLNKQNEIKLSSITDKSKKNLVFSFEKGKIMGIWLDSIGNLSRKEYMYVHFQKRNMKIKNNVINDSWIIIPNMFIDFIEIDKPFLKKTIAPPLIYMQFFRIKYNNLKNKIKRKFNCE